MTDAVPLQVTGLTEAQRAVRDHFQGGGSIGSVLLVVVVVAGIVLVACCVAWIQRRRTRKHAPIRDPKRLLGDLLEGLSLTASQRRLLERVAKDLRLENPAVLLLSPTLFDRHMDRWRALNRPSHRDAGRRGEDQTVTRTREVLFPRA